MTLAEDQERLEAYVKWKAEREVTGNDTSPAAYVVDRAKQEAFVRVEAAIFFIESWGKESWTEQDRELYTILTGER